ncbi:hypothetical protein BDD12DRAFT_863635 [Trichophaea hybrida]|nr:hypothetical protein BDD12DRAFT_863635 [Trichophaea hybrida]
MLRRNRPLTKQSVPVCTSPQTFPGLHRSMKKKNSMFWDFLLISPITARSLSLGDQH